MKEVNEPASSEFINESGLDFKNISSERYRQYVFPNGENLIINQPLYLNVSPSGGHRLFDNFGNSYYVQPQEGWYIKWQAKFGLPNFVK